MIELAAFLFLCFAGYKIVMWFVRGTSLQQSSVPIITNETINFSRSQLRNKNSAFSRGFDASAFNDGGDVLQRRQLFLTNDTFVKIRLSAALSELGINETEYVSLVIEEEKLFQIERANWAAECERRVKNGGAAGNGLSEMELDKEIILRKKWEPKHSRCCVDRDCFGCDWGKSEVSDPKEHREA